MTGRCQCGAVQFETTLDRPMAVYICHCLGASCLVCGFLRGLFCLLDVLKKGVVFSEGGR